MSDSKVDEVKSAFGQMHWREEISWWCEFYWSLLTIIDLWAVTSLSLFSSVFPFKVIWFLLILNLNCLVLNPLDQWQSYQKQGDMGSQDIRDWRKVSFFSLVVVSSLWGSGRQLFSQNSSIRPTCFPLNVCYFIFHKSAIISNFEHR